MKTTKQKVPTLRFPEFEGEWEEKKLGEVSETFSGGTPSVGNKQYYGGDIPFIKSGEIRQTLTADYITENGLSNSSAKMVKAGDILYALYGATSGEVGISKIDGAINQAILCIRSSLNHYFLFSQLEYNKTKITHTFLQGGQGNLSGQIVKDLKISFPSLPEQQKIADFLSATDKRLELLKEKKQGLEDYKRGAMQRIFSQELRFTRPDGSAYEDWEEKKLGEVAERVTSKNSENNDNVLTISAQQGLINQLKYFDNSVSGRNLENYYLMHKGDFAYNRSYSNGYPMGAIKLLKNYEKGIVSTLYICFRLKDIRYNTFFEQFFDSGYLNEELQKVAQEGARNHGLLNINLSDFFSIPVIIPSFEEQTQIANFLSAIDSNIEKLSEQIEKMESYKKGLLQQMFV